MLIYQKDMRPYLDYIDDYYGKNYLKQFRKLQKEGKKMNAKELWDKLLIENTGVLDPTGNILTPTKKYRIKGSIIKDLVKNADGKITINLERVDIINHEGENIDYSLYGTPKHSMGD